MASSGIKLNMSLNNFGKYTSSTTSSSTRRYCCYKGCNSDRVKSNGLLSFFSFPIKDTERCSKWISNIGREEFRYLTPMELGYKRLCELHFDRSMFANDFKTHLRKNSVPKIYSVPDVEVIQLDDDDQINDCESGVASEGSSASNAQNAEAKSNGHAMNVTNTSILSSVLTSAENDTSKGKTDELCHVVSPNKQLSKGACIRGAGDGIVVKDCSSKLQSKNTKFHNLPPQMPDTDFYYQQCPSIEESNNSYPEPPDGELPLFVQQDSVHSIHDEAPNSESPEPPPKKRKQDRDNDNNLSDQMRDALKHLTNITALLTSTDDEFELFGKSVALQLKKMSLCTALRTQAKIQQVLSQYRIDDIVKSTNNKLSVRVASENSEAKENPTVEKSAEGKEGEDTSNDMPASPQLSLTCASEHSDNEAHDSG